MKHFLSIASIILLGMTVYGQTRDDNEYIKNKLLSNKSEIITNDISKTLTEPVFWKAKGAVINTNFTVPAANNGFWFGKDGLYLECSSLIRNYGSFLDQDINSGLWSFNGDVKTLTFEFYNTRDIYNIILLNSNELIIEDSLKNRFFLVSQKNLFNAPDILQRYIRNTSNSAEKLKEIWSIDRENDKEKLYTIYYCEAFSNNISLVAIDSDYKSDDRNYGHGRILYGYINKDGEYLIKPKYEKAYSFSNGFALVSLKTKGSNNWEFINAKGINVFNKFFSDAKSFSEGFAAIRFDNGGWGFIDSLGNVITEQQYEEVGDFKEGLAKVCSQNKWGFIDKSGKEIIYPQFISVSDFYEGWSAIKKDIEYADFKGHYYVGNLFINKDGKTLNPYGEIIKSFKNGFALIRDVSYSFSYPPSYGNFGYITIEGKIKLNRNLRQTETFVEGIAVASNGKYYGYVDETLRWVIKPQFDEANSFSEGLASVRIGNNWGFINKKGIVIINPNIQKSNSDIQTTPNFESVTNFIDGISLIKVRNKYGFIDLTGNWIISPELLDAKPFNNGIAIVKQKNRKGWNFIDKSGNIIFTKFL